MALSLEKLAGKVAVVTGASSGIGAAIAKRLVKQGLTVVGIARRVDLIKQMADELKGEKGKMHAVKADLAIEKEIHAAFEQVAKHGIVHVLVNSAGGTKHGKVIDHTTTDYRNVFDVNVIALTTCCREAIKVMRANGVDHGQIINVNSVLGHKIIMGAGTGVYTASKYAVTAVTETIRGELATAGSKIKITSLSPGFVSDTEMTTLRKSEDSDPEIMKALKGMPSLKPHDVADSVVYILSTPDHVQISELTIKATGEMF